MQKLKIQVSPQDPEHVKELVIGDILRITFYPEPDIEIEVENKYTKTYYTLTTRDANYEDPWFSDYERLTKEINEYGEEKVVQFILDTIRRYFDPAYGMEELL